MRGFTTSPERRFSSDPPSERERVFTNGEESDGGMTGHRSTPARRRASEENAHDDAPTTSVTSAKCLDVSPSSRDGIRLPSASGRDEIDDSSTEMTGSTERFNDGSRQPSSRRRPRRIFVGIFVPALPLLLLLLIPRSCQVHAFFRSAAPRGRRPHSERREARPSFARKYAPPARVWGTASEGAASSPSDDDDDGELASRLVGVGRRTFQGYFDFPLDEWQLRAGGAIVEGHNVVVCAPTGAGKTVVGEMALLHAHHNLEKSGIYTTPLKALSNQKYSDLRRIFGRSSTGLSTGDVSINKGANITVMTTEVYRNIAWRSSTPHATGGTAGVDMGTDRLGDTSVVVLDEFHYMGHPDRGGVWEECVITSPPHVVIVGLSATLANADALASWMGNVTGRRTVLVDVSEERRPVPLRYLFATGDGLFPLFRDPDAGPGAPRGLLGYRAEGRLGSATDRTRSSERDGAQKRSLPRGLRVNPTIKAAAAKRVERVNRSIERQRRVRERNRLRRQADDEDEWGGRGGGGRRRGSRAPQRASLPLSPRAERRERERLLRNEIRRAIPSPSDLVGRLDQGGHLPAIFFIFSRAGCEEAARSVCRVMRGRHRLFLGGVDRDSARGVEIQDVEGNKPSPTRKKRKSRQRGRNRGGGLVEDANGRAFRPSSTYVSEDVLVSIMEATERLGEDEFDASSLLSPSNWDDYAKVGLLNYDEVQEVASRISVFNRENPEIAFDDEVMEQCVFGVGSHHAGMLPAHKSFVENLYKNQLMKVVFATETLAAGINMPARTTVVCALAKRGDGGSMNLLETSNLLQMAGRAGRRGMDNQGTCVIVPTPFEGSDEAAKILTDPIQPISSQFRPSYSLAINLVARGVGRLDVARQLVSKSFAMWQRRHVSHGIATTIDSNGEGVSEVLRFAAQESFLKALVDALQLRVDEDRAKNDSVKIESLLGVLTDREVLKRVSKSYIGAIKTLELERKSLGYLEMELSTMRLLNVVEDDDDEMSNLAKEDEKELLDQIEIQRHRTLEAEELVNRHHFSIIASIANDIMNEDCPEGGILYAALRKARDGPEDFATPELQASELSKYAKAAIVLPRQTRKLASDNPDLDTDYLLEAAADTADISEDSWNDMLSIIKTLVAYGCLSIEVPADDMVDYESQSYTVTPAGVNIGMLGFDNSLWSLVAMGGAWDVVGASSKLDEFRKAIVALEDEDYDWYEEEKEGNGATGEIPQGQVEAKALVKLLKSMSPSEIAGYVSCLVAERNRGDGPTVVELFHGLSPVQQRVIQSSLLVMERLMEVQKVFSVDEVTRGCSMDISNAEVVTAWAAGCSWNEALQISGSSPGDLCRTLSRVLDAVRQLGNLPFVPIRLADVEGNVETVSPGIHPDVRGLCREAARAINRYPVKDPLAFETSTEDEGDILETGEDDSLSEALGDNQS